MPATQTESDATRDAYAALIRAADKRPDVSESTLDRLRVRWDLCQLVDAGVVTSFYRSGSVGWLITARGSRGERCYRTTRELEAFVHGAFAALNL